MIEWETYTVKSHYYCIQFDHHLLISIAIDRLLYIEHVASSSVTMTSKYT